MPYSTYHEEDGRLAHIDGNTSSAPSGLWSMSAKLLAGKTYDNYYVPRTPKIIGRLGRIWLCGGVIKAVPLTARSFARP